MSSSSSPSSGSNSKSSRGFSSSRLLSQLSSSNGVITVGLPSFGTLLIRLRGGDGIPQDGKQGQDGLDER
jgi:hypothetical protein